MSHFARPLSKQGGHAGEGEGNGQEHPGSEVGQACQHGEGEQPHLHSNQLGHKEEKRKPKAGMGTQTYGYTQVEIQGQCQGEACGVHSKGCGTDSMAWRWDAEGGTGCSVSGRDEMNSWAKTHPGTPFSKPDGHRGSMEKIRMEQHPR